MERSQYDRSLRHTACSTSYISPERDSSTSSSSDSIYTGGVRNCPDQKRLQFKSTNLPAQRLGCAFNTGVEGDKAGMRRSSIQAYPHSTATMQPGFLQQPGPMVQMDNRLTEEHPRRIHCYISHVESEDAAPSDHAPPPLLPSLETLDTAQDIPFWRPPRVLQREPHYNYLMTAQPASAYGKHPLSALPPYRQDLQPQHQSFRGGESTACYTYYRDESDDPSTSDIAEASTSHLSPALLAISNSHYQQQKRQERQGVLAVSTAYSATRPSKPTIQSLLSATIPSPDTQLDDTCKGTQTSDSKFDSGIKPNMCADSKDCNSGGSHRQCLPGINSSQSWRRHEMKLPPLDSHSRPRCPGALREAMSIASLVDASRATSEHIKQTEKPMHLPGISSLEPAYASKQDVSSATDLQTAGALCSQTTPSKASANVMPASNSRFAGSCVKPQRKRPHGEASAAMTLHKMARIESQTSISVSDKRAAVSSLRTLQQYPLCPSNQVLITCYHASVAQKSYGGEKRFLCPPPAVLMYGEGYSARTAHHSPMLLSVITDSAVADKAEPPSSLLKGSSSHTSKGTADAAALRPSASAHAPLECQTSFNERNVALFKSLHVTGMQKAKSFRLRLDLMTPPGVSGQLVGHDQSIWQSPKPYVSLKSNPVAIISKPSKKTAKARNQSSCIREGSLISLFNRINSQTFRTKYLNVDHNTNRWVAQSHNWSPLEVVVTSSKNSRAVVGQAGTANPLYYGSEIVLVESRRNFRSPTMIIHKVERGRLVENACSPVSQMQKIALQVKPTAPSDAPRYLKADVGHYSPASSDASTPARFDDPDGSPELTFEPLDNARLSRARSREHVSDGGIELDDAFCWTIVGISGFTYAYTLPAEQSVKNSNIGPIPRIEEAELKAEMVLNLRLAAFDCSHMQLLLNGQSLDLKPCSTAKTAEKDPSSSRFTIQLPADAKSGALYIRRADGVMYHTKWAIQQPASSSKGLELVACNLDI
ncbi:hypothetical protein IWW36_002745 [Coemansia brasiliensis]|uniref:Uncharacterized protein n=1 Tax=Coemansia brasiliensis TaxID=2650707 RepID=A0A9W8LXV2_9FUNG|nr:hypothetical protein IWW36_002745 [Coemansia brasiliensis]